MSKTDWQKRCEEARRMMEMERDRADRWEKESDVLRGKVSTRDEIIERGKRENERLTNLLIEATLKLKTVADREAAWLKAGEADLHVSVLGQAPLGDTPA